MLVNPIHGVLSEYIDNDSDEDVNDGSVLTLKVGIDESWQRVDKFVADRCPQLSRSRLQRLIEQGTILINHVVCTSKKTMVQPGDGIQITIPPVQPLALIAEPIPLAILYEDTQLVIVNKPAGMVVHPSAGHERGTLVNALLAHCKHLSGIGGIQRPGIVHRLDKDTSGAIAVAKTDEAHQQLQQQFQAKTAYREYWGMAYGAPRTSTGTINQPIGRHPTDRKKMAVIPMENGGKPAVTHWQIQERLGHYTLIQFRLETGRTHQIRVHSAHIGHPIVGDPLYSSHHNIGVNLPGQALHAWRLRLQHPISHEWIAVTAPLPTPLETLTEVLRRRHPACDSL
ncbi:MAG: RluA family pseudouridine synthase [Synechococcales cyanobacterium]